MAKPNPNYVDGYVTGYRYFTDATTLLATGSTDVGYTPPMFQTGDNGLVYPLDKAQVTISEGVLGTSQLQEPGIHSAFASAAYAAQLGLFPPNSVQASIMIQQIQILAQANSVSRNLQRNPVYYEAQLKPTNSGPVFDVYQVQLTDLKVPRGINLEAGSTP